MMDKIEYLLMLAEDNRADNTEWSAEVHKIGLTVTDGKKSILNVSGPTAANTKRPGMFTARR